MTNEEAIEYLQCGAEPSCCCPSNKKHGGDCGGEDAVEEAIDIAIKALEKQIPKKAKRDLRKGIECYCPVCGGYVGWADALGWEFIKFCGDCGQRIADWSDEE